MEEIKKNLRIYVVAENSDFFGFIIPKGTVYKQNPRNKDSYRCYKEENGLIIIAPSFDLHFTIVENNERFIKTFTAV